MQSKWKASHGGYSIAQEDRCQWLPRAPIDRTLQRVIPGVQCRKWTYFDDYQRLTLITLAQNKAGQHTISWLFTICSLVPNTFCDNCNEVQLRLSQERKCQITLL